MNLFLEVVAVILNVLYLFFLIREQRVCWIFGITGSLVSIFLFYKIGLYSEVILYIYYVVIGIYGYQLWKKKDTVEKQLVIRKISAKSHVFAIGLGIFLSIVLGYVFASYTDAKSPYLDAFTTVFSFTASFLEAKKIISAWHFWIFINSATLFLYFDKGLNIYFLLTFFYVFLSFIGYSQWRKKM